MNYDEDLFVRVGVWLLQHEVIRSRRWTVDRLKFEPLGFEFQEWLATDADSTSGRWVDKDDDLNRFQYYHWMRVDHFLHDFEVWLKQLLGDQLPPITDYRGTNSVHFPSLVSHRLYGTLLTTRTVDSLTLMDTTMTPLRVIESDSKQDPLLPVDLAGHTLCACD